MVGRVDKSFKNHAAGFLLQNQFIISQASVRTLPGAICCFDRFRMKTCHLFLFTFCVTKFTTMLRPRPSYVQEQKSLVGGVEYYLKKFQEGEIKRSYFQAYQLEGLRSTFLWVKKSEDGLLGGSKATVQLPQKRFFFF